MIALPADRSSSRTGIRLLVATEVLGYVTAAFLMLALLAGGPRPWFGALGALAAMLVCLGLTLAARQRGPRAVRAPEADDPDEWRPPWAELYDHPTPVVARAAAFLFAVFSATSTAAALWVDGRTWSVPIAYATTAVLALAVWMLTRPRRSPE